MEECKSLIIGRRIPIVKGRIMDSSFHIDDFLGKKFPHRTLIIDPWLKEGTITLVYAERGIGKTLFSLAISVAVTRKLAIGPWETRTPVGCLYLDGEMSCEELQDRLRQFTAGLPHEQAPLHILSSEDLKAKNLPPINLAEESWRREILDDLKQNRIFRLLIIDNLSCLAPRISENSKKHWDDINQWLLVLRAIGVAVIIVHHTGKNLEQRGTSAREDNIDISISLRKIDRDPSFRGATFAVIFTKSRGLCGSDADPFIMRIPKDYRGRLPWETLSVERT
jgi:putative DNA primase/helicase